MFNSLVCTNHEKGGSGLTRGFAVWFFLVGAFQYNYGRGLGAVNTNLVC